ncbi:MAG: toxin HipA [Bdellovibrio sp.]|nr:MAG: toxin HipA [Bdellovibrio sp.]
MKKCLGCYNELETSKLDFHEKCSKRVFGRATPPTLGYELTEIKDLAKKVLNRRLAIPGAQPKLSLTVDSLDVTDARLTIVGLWEGIYILKPPNEDYPKLPENEDLTMHMAEDCGIDTAIHSLIRFKSGELAYISKRFDRVIKKRKSEKLAVEDMCQLTGQLTENKYNSSMEKVAKTTNDLTTNKGLEMYSLYQVILFSFLTGNSDMHLKNFSLLEQPDGLIGLSPAYDLLSTKLVVPRDREELALTLNGKKSRLNKKDFLNFARYGGLSAKAAENVFKKFENKLPGMKAWILKSFLTPEFQLKYLDLIAVRAGKIDLNVPANFVNLK